MGVAKGFRAEGGRQMTAGRGAPKGIARHIQLPVLGVGQCLPDGPGQIVLGVGEQGLLPDTVIDHNGVIAHAVEGPGVGVSFDEAANPPIAAAGADHRHGMHPAVTDKVGL